MFLVIFGCSTLLNTIIERTTILLWTHNRVCHRNNKYVINFNCKSMKELTQQELKGINGGVAPIVAAVCFCSGVGAGVVVGALGVYYGYELVKSMM